MPKIFSSLNVCDSQWIVMIDWINRPSAQIQTFSWSLSGEILMLYGLELLGMGKDAVWFPEKESVSRSVVLTFCNPMDYSPGSSVHGFFQARTLDWVTMPSSRGSSPSRGWTRVSCISGGFFTVWAAREATREIIWFLWWTYQWLSGASRATSLVGPGWLHHAPWSSECHSPLLTKQRALASWCLPGRGEE